MNQTNGLKLLALVIAVILWAYVRVTVTGISQNSITQLELKIPLELKGAGSHLIPYEVSTDTVSITVRGNSEVVDGLGEGLVRAYVDLHDVAAGSAWPEVQVVVPGNVQKVKVEPRSVNVRLSPVMSKYFPVEIIARGTPKQGFKAGDPVFEPHTVEIEGPEDLVRLVSVVRGTVLVEGLGETFSGIVTGLTPLNENGTTVMGKDTSLRFSVKEVQVTVPIEQKESVETIPVGVEKVRVNGRPGFHYDVEVDPQFVQVSTTLSPDDLPDNVQVPAFTFEPKSGETMIKELTLPQLDGASYVGGNKVRLILQPTKVEKKESGESE